MVSEVERAALRYRNELLRGSEKALAEWIEVYSRAWNKLSKRFESELAELLALSDAPEILPVRAEWISAHQRYHDLLSEVEHVLIRSGVAAAELIEAQQARATRLGVPSALQLMRRSYSRLGDRERRIIFATFNRPSHGAVANLIGVFGDGSPVRDKLLGMSQETMDKIRDEVAVGVIAGENPRKIAKRVSRTVGARYSRIVAVTRTEVLRAYRLSAMATYRANPHVVRGWVWVCAKQKRTCAACWAMDGSFHSLDETFSDHVCGRCTSVPSVRPYEEAAGLVPAQPTTEDGWEPDERFEALPEEDKLSILGRTRYELWRRGELRLRDMATMVRDPVWGGYPRVKTLSELAA